MDCHFLLQGIVLTQELKPGVLARVAVHRHHLGHQLARLGRPGHQLGAGRRGVLQRVEHEGRVVVGVRHEHAHQRLAAERGRAVVGSDKNH